jgi:hypothetical protein
MKTVKHSPGPWMARPMVRNTLITAADGTQVADSLGVADDDNVANAKLIAAAPDLADALEVFLEARASGSKNHMKLAGSAARSALKKAGRTP